MNAHLPLTPLGVKFYGDAAESDIQAAVDIVKLTSGMTREEIAARCILDMNFLAQFCAPETCTMDFPDLMVGMWNETIQGIGALQKRRGIMKLGLGIPRGFSKTLLAKLFVVYCILFTRHTFILVVGSVIDNADSIIKDVMAILDQPHVRAVFGDWDAQVEVNNANIRQFRLMGKDIILKPKGVCTSARGLSVNNRRPDFILSDDILSEEDAKSPVESAKIYGWFINTLLPAASPHGMIALYLGNMYNAQGCILSKLKRSSDWVTLTLGAILSDMTSLWEALHPVKKLLDEYKAACDAGQEASWLAQYMNGSQTDITKNIDFLKISEQYLRKFGRIEPEYQGKFIVVDPAGDKENADNTVILLAGIVDGSTCALEHITGVRNPMSTILEVVRLALAHNVRYIFIESVAYQASLIFWAQRTVDKHDLANLFEFVEIKPERSSKVARIKTMFSQAEQGQTFIHPNVWDRFRHEAKEFNPLKSNNDDNLLDAMHYMPIIFARYGMQIVNAYSEYVEAAALQRFARVQTNSNFRFVV